MNIRTVVVALSLVAAGLSASTAVYAAPMHSAMPVHAMFGKTKTVKLNVRNDSSAAMELKVGDSVMTVEKGKTIELKLAVGTRILANTATSTHQVGELLAEVSPELNEATIAIK